MMPMMGMNGGHGGLPMPGASMENPYAAEVVAAKQRIARLKDRLAQRAAARKALITEREGGTPAAEHPAAEDAHQVRGGWHAAHPASSGLRRHACHFWTRCRMKQQGHV